MSLPRMHWMCLRCQVWLGKPHHLTTAAPVEEPLDVVVVPTIDAERELAEIPRVGQLVAPPGLPVPSGHAEADLRGGRECWLALHVYAERRSRFAVVGAAGEHDGRTALEAAPVSGLGVSQVGAALVGVARGDLLPVQELERLVGDLRGEGRDPRWRHDVELFTRREEVGEVLFRPLCEEGGE